MINVYPLLKRGFGLRNFVSKSFVEAVMDTIRLGATLLWLALIGVSTFATAEVLNWQTGEVIPGPSRYQSGNYVKVIGFQNNLSYADFDGWDLTLGYFSRVTIENSRFRNADLSGITLRLSTFSSVDFSNANLSDTKFSDIELVGGNFTDSDLASAEFDNANLSNAAFAGCNLSGTVFRESLLSGADFTDAEIRSARLVGATDVGFTKEQLYATSSYAAGDMRNVNLSQNDLSGWDFGSQDLNGADFSYSALSDAVFENAVINNATFTLATDVELGIDQMQLYSSESYQKLDMRGVRISALDARNWSFADQDLSGANLSFSGETSHIDFSSADLTGARMFLFGRNSDMQFSNATIDDMTI